VQYQHVEKAKAALNEMHDDRLLHVHIEDTADNITVSYSLNAIKKPLTWG